MTITSKILPVCLLLALCLSALPAAASQARNKTEIVAEIDDYVRENMEANRISGAALAITYGEEVFYSRGYGEDAEGRKITDTTSFPIASLSKSMTALAVLQLVDEGLIELDAPYGSYFPGILPENHHFNQITVRNLLNQTSGLTDKVNPDMTRSVQFQSLQEIKKSLNLVKLANDPGETYSYHNPNYQYLALLVEQVSEQRFSEYLQHHIFVPLGMKDTFSVSTTEQINEHPAVVQGHYLLLGKPTHTDEPLWFIEGAAGVISTARDMEKWMRAQFDPRLLSPQLMEQYHAAGQHSPYGMGWLASNDDGWGSTISHSGIFWTYKSEERVFLEKQLGITMMFDTGINAFVDYSSFVRGISQIMNGEKADIPALNSRNMEMAMSLLMVGTIFWGGYSYFRMKKTDNWKSSFRRKLIFSSIWSLSPVLVLLFLSPIFSLIGGGRVLPWIGIWLTMPSLIIWLVLLSLVNLLSIICRCCIYYKVKKESKSGVVPQ
ncbi:serine hydrolase [Tumebacillus avium]|uniref:Serine hydrolase n=1 Tax=Tumebacillus avium TaxID=1903704 RepID=A0A1Y0IPZ9_9BACL|nr:serine hydrolase domain-containing protein [Tumebacillus avium]ARU62119.1 serine hydrolase [Tumebacillus avium]